MAKNLERESFHVEGNTAYLKPYQKPQMDWMTWCVRLTLLPLFLFVIGLVMGSCINWIVSLFLGASAVLAYFIHFIFFWGKPSPNTGLIKITSGENKIHLTDSNGTEHCIDLGQPEKIVIFVYSKCTIAMLVGSKSKAKVGALIFSLPPVGEKAKLFKHVSPLAAFLSIPIEYSDTPIL